MPNKKENLNSSFDDSVWNFLMAYPLSELITDTNMRDMPKTCLLIQTLLELGVKTELLNKIVRKLIKIAEDALDQSDQRKMATLPHLRIYCQNVTILSQNSTQPPTQEKSRVTIKSPQRNHFSGSRINGGWGFFLVNKAAYHLPGSSINSSSWIDVYPRFNSQVQL